MIGISILGSTGSIGLSTLAVIAEHPDRFRVVALTANTDVERMVEQALRYRPDLVAMADPTAAAAVAGRLRGELPGVRVLAGPDGLLEAATLEGADQVMAAIVGVAGLPPALAAVRTGRRLLLANKEALVVSGALFMQAARDSGAELLPIDSEHNAVFQCLPPQRADGLGAVGVRRILLTASGGPFRDTPLEALSNVTPEQACAHPNWSMGRKISVDSATMMNKGLEVIEAHWLFAAPAQQIDVVIHPQSIVHSMVEYVDGSVLAQLGNPDMRTPIAHALAWPQRLSSGVSSLDLCQAGPLEFRPPDLKRFPCLRLAYEAIEAGGTAAAVLNAANEVAVARFLAGELAFLAIPELLADVLEAVPVEAASSLEVLMAADRQARSAAEQFLKSRVA